MTNKYSVSVKCLVTQLQLNFDFFDIFPDRKQLEILIINLFGDENIFFASFERRIYIDLQTFDQLERYETWLNSNRFHLTALEALTVVNVAIVEMISGWWINVKLNELFKSNAALTLKFAGYEQEFESEVCLDLEEKVLTLNPMYYETAAEGVIQKLVTFRVKKHTDGEYCAKLVTSNRLINLLLLINDRRYQEINSGDWRVYFDDILCRHLKDFES